MHPSRSTDYPVDIKVKGGSKIKLHFTRSIEWMKVSFCALYDDRPSPASKYVPLTENYITVDKEKGIYSCVIYAYSKTAEMRAYYMFR